MGYDYCSIEAGHYDLVFRRKSGIRSKWHHQKFAEVRRLMGSYRRHLDVGCGPGTLIGTLTGPGHSVGVDIAPPQIEYARKNFSSATRSFAVIDGVELPFDDRHFDVVTMVEIVEHLHREECIRLLGEVRRVLRPGGALVMTTPNYGALWPVLEWLVDRLGPVAYADQHVVKHDRDSLRRFLSETGFGVEHLEGYLLFAPFAAIFGWRGADFVERVEPRVVRRNLGHLLIAKAISE